MTTASQAAVTGTFTSASGGGSPFQAPKGKFNATLSGFGVGTVKLERSFDAGLTWVTVSKDSSGSDASFTANCSLTIDEPEKGVLYRFNCSAWSSGTIAYRLSN
jgi:hypothetical protein